MSGASCAHARDQLPELAPRQRIDAGRRLVEDQKIGIMDERATKPELLPHAAGEFAGQPIREWQQARAREQIIDTARALGSPLPEQAAEKGDVLA